MQLLLQISHAKLTSLLSFWMCESHTAQLHSRMGLTMVACSLVSAKGLDTCRVSSLGVEQRHRLQNRRRCMECRYLSV